MLAAARERREANSIRERISYDDFRELMDGEGGFVYAGWCGEPRVRGADQGRDQGDDPRACPTRSSVRPRRRRRASSADAPSTVEALWAKAY